MSADVNPCDRRLLFAVFLPWRDAILLRHGLLVRSGCIVANYGDVELLLGVSLQLCCWLKTYVSFMSLPLIGSRHLCTPFPA